MRKFAGIIESITPPPTNCLWLANGELKANINGEWVTVCSENTENNNDKIVILDLSEQQTIDYVGSQAVTIENDNLIGGADTIVIRLHDGAFQILNNIFGFGSNFVYKGDMTDPKSFNEGITYSSKIIYAEGFLNIESGTFTFRLINTDIPNDIIGLEIGNSTDVKNHNIAILNKYNLPYFFTQLDYGYGVGTFNGSDGGFIHIINAYGNDIFYTIGIDGSISKEEGYIKPNEPYSVILTSDKIGTVLDNITADKIAKCGEIIITGTTGAVTYTRTSDSTPTAMYFSDERKDGRITVLTYYVSTKKIQSAIINPYLPDAAINVSGGVKMMYPIEDLEFGASLSNDNEDKLRSKINELLASLRESGIIQKSGGAGN